MAATPKALSRGLLTATSATLYTVPASTLTVVTSIAMANTSASAVVVTIALDGVALVPSVSLAGNTSTIIDLRQVLATGKLITGFAGTTNVVAVHISGSEVT